MNNELIGKNAGIVWNALNDHGALTFIELKCATMLSDIELYTAIGWLAREGKLAASNEDAYSLA